MPIPDDPPPRPGELAAPVPSAPPPVEAATAPEGRAARFYPLLGFIILTACLETGEWLKAMFGLILPGNILGLFLLLTLLGAGIVPLRWMESAARWLLWLLPLLFMPIFTLALKDHDLWRTQGRDLFGAVAAGMLILWVVTGHVAQWTLKPAEKPAPAAPPR